MVAPDKQALRAEARAARAQFVADLPITALRFAFRAIPSPLAARLAPFGCVALYSGLDDEAPADRLAEPLRKLGKTVALPAIGAGPGEMTFLRWDADDALVTGRYGILQPSPGAPAVTPGAIVAPMIAFDHALNRLGQGGGYYDRAFAAYPLALRIGLAWSAQQMDALPVDPWDMGLDFILTERALFERDGA